MAIPDDADPRQRAADNDKQRSEKAHGLSGSASPEHKKTLANVTALNLQQPLTVLAAGGVMGWATGEP
jgi:hypothetical protein